MGRKRKTFEDYEQEIYYLQDIMFEYERRGRGCKEDYLRAIKRLAYIRCKLELEENYGN